MLLDQAFLTDPNYYELLHLEPSATHHDVQNAFHEESMVLNLKSVDSEVRLQAAEKMLELTRAYETLSDPMMRARYDVQTLGRVNAPSQERIEVLFKEGIRAWKRSETDLALRYLKEVASLYPHRPLYRVHLAIAYAEKKWYNFTETELETALRLDPDYKFAKETIARLLFKVPDRKQSWFQSRLNQQVALMTMGFVGLAVFIASGIPGQMIQKLTGGWGQEKALDAKTIEAQLPDDMKQALSENTVAVTQIPYFPADYKPAGEVFDYTKLEAVNKVFYAAQNTVAITYKDGSVLTYKPAALKGWKKVSDMPIMITANNELIPSPSSLPLKTGDGKLVDINAFDFPQPYFPEYFDSPAATSTAPVSVTPPAAANDTAATSSTPSTSNTPSTSAKTDSPANSPESQPQTPKVYNPYGN